VHLDFQCEKCRKPNEFKQTNSVFCPLLASSIFASAYPFAPTDTSTKRTSIQKPSSAPLSAIPMPGSVPSSLFLHTHRKAARFHASCCGAEQMRINCYGKEKVRDEIINKV
jgi:hypothetical protein